MNRKRIRQMNTLLLRRLHKRPAAEFFEHREAFLQTLEQENFMQRFAPLLGEERLRCKCVLELCLRNGTVPDCNGCSYTACLHFGEQGSCFYGGPMVEEVYPAVRHCDALVMLCANYNDALSANLTACVNRLTALFRQQRFYSKRLFSLVVSGYSGGDLLARQLISALNMNKSFFLPPHFCLLETANERGSLVKLPGIETRARAFARQMAQS